jgi:hypothetical protein
MDGCTPRHEHAFIEFRTLSSVSAGTSGAVLHRPPPSYVLEMKLEVSGMRCIVLAALCVGLLGFAGAPTIRADEWDKRTTLTVNETIQVPNKVLPPGTYVIKLLDSPGDRHIVQVFNSDETELLTTILAIPNYRLRPTDKSVFTFWETPPGQAKALRAWFYPGDNFGQEFAYPKRTAVAIASVSHAEVPTTEAVQPAELTAAPVETVTEEPVPEVRFDPAPAPVEIAEQIQPPAPEPAAAPPELPKTASPYPLIGLAGVLLVLASAALRFARSS